MPSINSMQSNFYNFILTVNYFAVPLLVDGLGVDVLEPGVPELLLLVPVPAAPEPVVPVVSEPDEPVPGVLEPLVLDPGVVLLEPGVVLPLVAPEVPVPEVLGLVVLEPDVPDPVVPDVSELEVPLPEVVPGVGVVVVLVELLVPLSGVELRLQPATATLTKAAASAIFETFTIAFIVVPFT
jgi:hypothetical protein